MSLEGLLPRGEALAQRAATAKRDDIIARADLPAGIAAEPVDGGIMLSSRNLRRRLIENPQIRNFAR